MWEAIDVQELLHPPEPFMSEDGSLFVLEEDPDELDEVDGNAAFEA